MKKIILLSVFSIAAFYLGQAMACNEAATGRHNRDHKQIVTSTPASPIIKGTKKE